MMHYRMFDSGKLVHYGMLNCSNAFVAFRTCLFLLHVNAGKASFYSDRDHRFRAGVFAMALLFILPDIRPRLGAIRFFFHLTWVYAQRF